MGQADAGVHADRPAASHTVNVVGSKRLRFELNVQNLFNQKTTRHIFNFLNKGPPDAIADRRDRPLRHGPRAGLRLQRADSGDARWANAFDPRYGMPDLFEDGARAYITVQVRVLSSRQ